MRGRVTKNKIGLPSFICFYSMITACRVLKKGKVDILPIQKHIKLGNNKV